MWLRFPRQRLSIPWLKTLLLNIRDLNWLQFTINVDNQPNIYIANNRFLNIRYHFIKKGKYRTRDDGASH
jgi:hypothetical protein